MIMDEVSGPKLNIYRYEKTGCTFEVIGVKPKDG